MRSRKRTINSTTARKKPQIKIRKAKASTKIGEDSTNSYLLPVLIEEGEVEEPRAKRRVTKSLKNTASKTSKKENIICKNKNTFKCRDVVVRLSNLNLSQLPNAKNKSNMELKPETEKKEDVLHTEEDITAPGGPSLAKVIQNNSKKQKERNGKEDGNRNFGDSAFGDSFTRQKIQIVISESKITYESIQSLPEINCEYNEKTNSESYSEKQKEVVGCKNNKDVAGISKISDIPSLSYLDDESDFIDLDTITLVELVPHVIGDKELKLKENNKKKADSGNFNLTSSSSIKPRSPQKTRDNLLGRNIICLNKYPYVSLQDIVDWFMKNTQLNCVRYVNALKKGLCFSWLTNNYFCHNQQCRFSHNAFKFFLNKLKKYPSKFLMILTVSMRKDDLFEDVIMATFEILSARQISIIWITFLAYFVFYVTEPSDCRFLKFWANTARFFCQLNKDFSDGNGFASLLSIFNQSRKPEEWKIIEFVKLITKSPIQIRVTYALLQPILNMDIPPQLLADAVESCLETQEDVLNVYLTIIPKLPLMTLPVHVVELLLKFCKTLETMGEKDCAQKLKQKLQPKLQTFKIKILDQDFPLTALFQQELSESLCDGNDIPTTSSCEEKKESGDFNGGSKYFEPKNNFYNVMIQAMGSGSNRIPCQFRKTIKPPTMVDIQNDFSELVTLEEQIHKVRQFSSNCQFDLLGKYFNELRKDAVLPAAEEFLKSLFQTEISLGQVVNLMKNILFSCKSQNSANVIGCISKTLVLNLVKINEWEKAHTLVSLCDEKQINIPEGVVYVSDDLASFSQFRVALLLIEIYAFKENYKSALDVTKKYYLYSPNSSLWKLSWDEYDETVRIEVLEKFLRLILSDQLAEMSFHLFELIWKEQKDLARPVDLRKFVDKVLILLLNEGNEEALNLFNIIKSQVDLNESTARAILVTLVRQNRLIAAKSLLLFYRLTTYVLPEISSNSVVMQLSSFWLEEEIYIMFDTLFDLLAAREYRNIKSGAEKTARSFEVLVNISKRETTSTSVIPPLCLGLINSSFKHTCIRIERVLKNEFTPPVSILITPQTLKLDGYSLQLHLSDRIRKHLW